MSGLVLEEHRPTLADLLRPRLARLPRRLRWLLGAVVVLLVLFVLWRLLAGGDAGETHYVHRGALEFNFRYPDTMEAVRRIFAAQDPGT